MSTKELPRAEDVIAQYLPLHGPYSDDHTRLAASLLRETVRYLNYATGQGAPTALPWASSVAAVTEGAAGAAGLMDQTLRQLFQRCNQLAASPTLYDHSDKGNHAAAELRIRKAQDALVGAFGAVECAGTLHDVLEGASSQLNYLGTEDA